MLINRHQYPDNDTIKIQSSVFAGGIYLIRASGKATVERLRKSITIHVDYISSIA